MRKLTGAHIEKFPEFPDIKAPRETALAGAEKVARLAAGRGLEPGLGHLADGWRPAGEPLAAPDAFLDWYATRHDDVPAAMTEAAATIHEEWGPHEYPDERSFCACSPHRIEMAAHPIRESYRADHANPALRLLPEWTQVVHRANRTRR